MPVPVPGVAGGDGEGGSFGGGGFLWLRSTGLSTRDRPGSGVFGGVLRACSGGRGVAVDRGDAADPLRSQEPKSGRRMFSILKGSEGLGAALPVGVADGDKRGRFSWWAFGGGGLCPPHDEGGEGGKVWWCPVAAGGPTTGAAAAASSAVGGRSSSMALSPAVLFVLSSFDARHKRKNVNVT